MQHSKEYEIFKPQLPFLQEQLAALNKRATKIGCAPIVLEVLSERMEVSTLPGGLYEQAGELVRAVDLEEVRIFVKVRLTGNVPKYEGWTFAATIQHLPATQTSDAFDIIRAVPGFEIPTQYRDRAQVCDHCGHKRYRKDTFIIQHSDGTWKQVGRQCLKDFLGHKDPHALAAEFELFISALTLVEDAAERFTGYRGWEYFTLESYLKWVAGVIRVRGWLSRTNAQMRDQKATADWVCELLSPIPIKNPTYARQVRELYEQATPTEADCELTTKAIEWAAQLDPGENDYLYNVHTIAKAGVIDRKLVGYAASIIPAYQRAMDELQKRQIAETTSNHFGTVGQRAVFTLTVLKMVNLDGRFPSTLHIFQDVQGNQAVWFASKKSGFNIGGTVTVKATIKEHNVRNGVKQTILTRIQ